MVFDDMGDRGFTVAIMVGFIFVVLFLVFIIWSTLETQKSECLETFGERYGYKTEWRAYPVGNGWGKPVVGCVVYMEDGTQVLLKDFRVADYKKPAGRG